MLGSLIRNSMVIAISAISMAVMSAAAHASSLDDIITNKKISVGVITDNHPFGFLDVNQKPDGYEIDIARLMAKSLGVEVEFVPLGSQNRIPFLLSGKVDAVVGLLSISGERAKQVAFSNPYNMAASVIFAPKTTKLESPEDLAGLRIGVGTANAEEGLVVAIAPPTTQVLRFDNTLDAAQALMAGQVDAHAGGDMQLALFNKARPDLGIEIKLVLRTLYQGIAVRREDTDLVRWMNTWLFAVKTNGELETVYRKWFDKPLPDLPTF